MKKIIILLLSVTFLFGSGTAQAQSTKSQTGNPILSFFSKVITLNNPVVLENPKEGFKIGEQPKFEINVPQKTDEAVGKTVENKFQTKEEKVEAYFVYNGTKEKIPAEIKKDAKGEFTVAMPVEKDDEPKRGNYTLNITAKESFIYERNLTQDFSWGVLAINTNKSIYLPNETAQLSVGVLNETGSTICNADLELTISDPDKKETKLTTKNKQFVLDPTCGNNFTPQPDYGTSYKVNKSGKYYMNIKATTINGTHQITDYFEVRDSVPFDIERVNFPTRMYPAAAYEVKLAIKANEDYKGKVTDTVLKSFKVTNISGNGKYTEEPNFEIKLPSKEVLNSDKDVYKRIKNKSEILYTKLESIDETPTNITWDVDWKKGQTYTLTYTLNFPPISPEFYLIGPFKVGSFEEIRQWQIASDATRCWDGGGADALWSSQNNWSGDTVPGSADTAKFDNTGTGCTGTVESGNRDKNSTIDGSFAGTIDTLNISAYTGTITQATDLTVNNDWIQAAGTFNDSANTVAINDDYTYSGGTFNADEGTFSFEFQCCSEDTTPDLTGSSTFYNLTFSTDSNAANTVTLASGTTVTVTNNLALDDTDGVGVSSVNGPGVIHAKGNISNTRDGWQGTANLYIDGTGNQTINGDTDVGSFYTYYILNPIIDKPSGTLTLANYIGAADDWTYIKGAINPGDSEVIFFTDCCDADTTSDIVGSMTFDSLTFETNSNATITHTISSGSIVTVNDTLTFSDSDGVGSSSVNGPGQIHLLGNMTNSGSVDAWEGDVNITLKGSEVQTIDMDLDYGFTTGDFTINKTGGKVVLAQPFQNGATDENLIITSGILDMASYDLYVPGTLTINGQLNQFTGLILAGQISVGSTGIWTNNSTGDITLIHTGSGVSNAGYIRLDGGGAQCGDSDSISINTTNPGTAVNWSGAGTYIIIDTTYQDVNDSGITLTTYSSTETSNSDWVGNSGCPTYSNRNVINFQSGTTFNGGVSFNSN